MFTQCPHNLLACPQAIMQALKNLGVNQGFLRLHIY